MMKKFLKYSALVLAMIVVMIGLFVWFASRDIAPQDMSDLAIIRQQVPTQANGYTTFLEATHLLTQRTNKCLYLGINKPVDTNGILQILESNEPAINLIEKATQCTIFRQPEVSFTNLYAHFSSREFMARLLAFKIQFDCIPSGRFEEAVQTGINSLKFSNMHLQDTRCFLDLDSSYGLLSFGLFSIRKLVTREVVSSEQLTHLAQELNSLDSINTAYRNALKGEFQYMSTGIEMTKDGTFFQETSQSFAMKELTPTKRVYVPALILHPNRTIIMIADECRERLKKVEAPYSEMTNTVDDAASKDTWFFRFKPNLFGYIILDTYRKAADHGFKHKCKLESEIAATRLVVACHLYRKKEAKFPLRLDDLVPEYLPAVPVDPYDGKPFRYVPEKAIIYSVGEDLADSGGAADVLGTSGYPIKKAKDLVYPLVN